MLDSGVFYLDLCSQVLDIAKLEISFWELKAHKFRYDVSQNKMFNTINAVFDFNINHN